MSGIEHIGLIDRLRALPSETEWFEFKRNHFEPRVLGEYLSALANAACLASQPRDYLVFGIDDETHAVVGTRFDPYATKARGNQDLLPWPRRASSSSSSIRARPPRWAGGTTSPSSTRPGS